MKENVIYIDRNWKFDEEFSEEMTDPRYDDRFMDDVQIPHTVREMPLHYFDESIYQMVSGYRRVPAPPARTIPFIVFLLCLSSLESLCKKQVLYCL